MGGMKVDIPRIKARIVEKNLTQESLAESMGIGRVTLYRKMSGGGLNFTLKEIGDMAKELSWGIRDLEEVFFCTESQK